jgi:hypothetical protein
MSLPASEPAGRVTGQQQLTELAVTKRSDLLPETVISGFFGSGKSVLASQLLRHSGARRVVVATRGGCLREAHLRPGNFAVPSIPLNRLDRPAARHQRL